MDLLKRRHAPILAEAWAAIDQEAKRVLGLELAGRKIVDFDGPHGWKLAAVNTGRVTPVESATAMNVEVGLRRAAPLVEVRVPFVLSIAELDAIGRGAVDPDLDPVIEAAEKAARFEDGAIFNGYAPANIAGVIPSSPHPAIEVPAAADWPRAVAKAKDALQVEGIDGPYALVAGKSAFDELSAGSEDGYPLRKHVEQQLEEGAIVWAPAVERAVLVSTRGTDYELTVGQDLAIGYASHDRERVTLFLTESFTFRVLEPAAAVALHRG